MGERRVDREAWAHEITRLLKDEARGNKSAFARLIGVASVKTIDRWLTQSVDVSEESVRLVAKNLNLPLADLMVTVGMLDASHLTGAGQAVVEDAEAIRVIEDADIPPSLKRQLLAHLRDQREEHERQRLAEVQRTIDLIAKR